jgi:hypothetical protein
MNPTEKITMIAQLLLSVLFVAGYFLVVAGFMLGYVQVPVDYKEAFMALLGVATASVVQLFSFWFARQRGGQNAS